MNKQSLKPDSDNHVKSSMKTVFIILQILFVAAVFILWFTSESLRESRSLWILAVCAVPANFVTGVIPYDPAVIFFARYHAIFPVVGVGVVSILLVEGINYSILKTVLNARLFTKVHDHRLTKKLIRLFDRRPFPALLAAGFLPLPFYPFRLLVALSGYPFYEYILSVLISRTPRLLLLVLLGHTVEIPDAVFYGIYIGMVVAVYLSAVISSIRKKTVGARDG